MFFRPGSQRINQTCKKFVSFRDPSLEFIIISAKYPTKNQQFRHFTQIDDWFLLQNCQNTLYFIILSTKEVLFLLKTSILLQLWKKFPQLYRNFRDPGSRGSRVFPCLASCWLCSLDWDHCYLPFFDYIDVISFLVLYFHGSFPHLLVCVLDKDLLFILITVIVILLVPCC